MRMSLQKRLEFIRRIYLRDARPWVVAFSGGKDSTAVLQLLWLAITPLKIDDRLKPIIVAYVDTGMDHPAYSELVSATLSRVDSASKAQQFPFKVHVLRPELRHRYFVAVIGRGYAPPTHWFRWCTRSMRIRPMNIFIKKNLSGHKELVIALGLRRSESQARNLILAKYANGKPFQGAYGNFPGAIAFTPIEDLSVDEVWQFLMQTPCPWGDRNRSLARLYSLGSGGECASYSLGDGMSPTCGGSRFGCWTCTVVRHDRAGEGLAEEDERYELLLDFRNWLSEIRYDYKRRWRLRRNGSPGPGPLRLSTRREILHRLGTIQLRSGFKLLKDQELDEIQKLWMLDGDRKSSALSIWKRFREVKSREDQKLVVIQPRSLLGAQP